MCCVVWWRVSSEVFVGTVRSGVDERVKEKEGTSGCGEEESAGEEGGKALQRRRRRRRRWRRRQHGDLHNVYYANLGQRGCINKCYIIIQIKCFNLHTFYRPPAGMRNASPARDTRSTRGTTDTRPSFASFKCPPSVPGAEFLPGRFFRWRFRRSEPYPGKLMEIASDTYYLRLTDNSEEISSPIFTM